MSRQDVAAASGVAGGPGHQTALRLRSRPLWGFCIWWGRCSTCFVIVGEIMRLGENTESPSLTTSLSLKHSSMRWGMQQTGLKLRIELNTPHISYWSLWYSTRNCIWLHCMSKVVVVFCLPCVSWRNLFFSVLQYTLYVNKLRHVYHIDQYRPDLLENRWVWS